MADRIPVALAGHVYEPGTPPAVFARHNRDRAGRLQCVDAYFDDLPGVRFFIGRHAVAFQDAAIYDALPTPGREEDTWTISVECKPISALLTHGVHRDRRGVPAPADRNRPVPWQPIVSAGSIRDCLLYVANLIKTREQPFLARLRAEINRRDVVVFAPLRCGKYSLSVQASSLHPCLPRVDTSVLDTYFAWSVFLPESIRVHDLAGAWPKVITPGDPYGGETVIADLDVLFGEHHEPDERMTQIAGFVPSAVVQRLVEALDRLGEDQGPTIAACEPAGACDLGEWCSVHRGVDPSRVYDEEDEAHEAARRAREPNGVDRIVAQSFNDALRGNDALPAPCTSCDGSGRDDYDGTEHDCQVCHGRGVVAGIPVLTPVVVMLNGREILRVLPNGPTAELDLDTPLRVQRDDVLFAAGFHPIRFGSAEPTTINRIVIHFGMAFNVYGYQGTRPLMQGSGPIESGAFTRRSVDYRDDAPRATEETAAELSGILLGQPFGRLRNPVDETERERAEFMDSGRGYEIRVHRREPASAAGYLHTSRDENVTFEQIAQLYGGGVYDLVLHARAGRIVRRDTVVVAGEPRFPASPPYDSAFTVTGRVSSTEPNLQRIRRTPGPREAAHQPTYDTHPSRGDGVAPRPRERPHEPFPFWNPHREDATEDAVQAGVAQVQAEARAANFNRSLAFSDLARRGEITMAEVDVLLRQWHEHFPEIAGICTRVERNVAAGTIRVAAVRMPDGTTYRPPEPSLIVRHGTSIRFGEPLPAPPQPKGPPPAPRSKRRSERARNRPR